MRTEFGSWCAAKYPYDRARCGLCASAHAPGIDICKIPEHAEMRRVAKEMQLRPPNNFADIMLVVKFHEFRQLFAGEYEDGR
jgi:hypothetical protein